MDENDILQLGIRALDEIGINAKDSGAINGHRGDHVLELSPKNSGDHFAYFFEIKKHLNKATLNQWIFYNEKIISDTYDLALLTEYVTPAMGERLREMGISYLDTAGNAYFNKRNFYIYVTGKKPKERKPRSVSLFRPAGIKLLLHLLSQPGLEVRDYRELAEITNVPKTSIGEVMNELERLNFLVFYKHKRRLTNKPELLRRWVEAFAENYRPKLTLGIFRTAENNENWWEKASISEFHACWGGEIAAQKLVGHIKPKIATIYANSLLPKLQAKYGLRRDPSGSVEILNKFWPGEIDQTTPPLVVYADLIFSGNDRDLETARMIYEKYLYRLIEDSPQ